ncbi:MAG: hypothetical protein K9L02_04090 [Acholeplasmataceae bacterium]|nr:hypothetical protein [Acholeplasmataceae bacterium]
MMKKREIVKLFKSNIEAHVPQSIPQVDWSMLASNQQNILEIEETRRPAKIIFSFKAVLATVFVMAMVIFGIGLFNNQPIPVVQNPYTNATYKDTLSVSAVSTATLMSNYATTTISTNQALSFITPLASTETITTIEPYLGMIETVTGQNAGITTTTMESDNALYESKVLLSTFDLLGNRINYTLYFNTISFSESENESTFEIEGIFLYKSYQFDFVGRKEIEDDEEIITFKTQSGASNYVESIYKVEDNESKYSIVIVENDQIISQSKIKIVDENEERKIDFEYIDGLNYGIYQFKYEVENGINLLKIEYETRINGIEESGSMKVEIKIDPLTTVTSYQIFVKPDDEEEYEYESDRHVDDEDEDDDEEDPEDPEDPEDEEDPEDTEDEEDPEDEEDK